MKTVPPFKKVKSHTLTNDSSACGLRMTYLLPMHLGAQRRMKEATHGFAYALRISSMTEIKDFPLCVNSATEIRDFLPHLYLTYRFVQDDRNVFQ